jgi:hypothetical protein
MEWKNTNKVVKSDGDVTALLSAAKKYDYNKREKFTDFVKLWDAHKHVLRYAFPGKRIEALGGDCGKPAFGNLEV